MYSGEITRQAETKQITIVLLHINVHVDVLF